MIIYVDWLSRRCRLGVDGTQFDQSGSRDDHRGHQLSQGSVDDEDLELIRRWNTSVPDLEWNISYDEEEMSAVSEDSLDDREGMNNANDNACEVQERAEGNMGKNIEFIQKDRT